MKVSEDCACTPYSSSLHSQFEVTAQNNHHQSLLKINLMEFNQVWNKFNGSIYAKDEYQPCK